ncbi:MAG: hypothetical protein QOE70_4143 [Chthoniobacter sp.]|jgi:cytochrome c553|nr:hypothetical protein [Chthoniobacter sp.]
MKILRLLLAALAWASPVAALEETAQPVVAPTPEQRDFFEKKIRPVLTDKCYKCHSEKAEKIKGGLLLDTREGSLRGGDNGPAVVPGNLKESLLIEAIHYTNKDFSMPPEKSGGKLPEAVIKDFETWISMGAPDPRSGAAKVVKKYDTGEARKWWSYQPVQKPAAPAVKDAAWPRSDTDKLVLASLEAKGLKPVGDADPATLLRRLYFDLIGLPPSPQDLDAFLKAWTAANQSPARNPQSAIEKVVDRLLASPQFGERWGRHWLDVARYAESSGKDVNIAYPHAWRYRDYVIESFNEDKPYDRFIREQIAGDLLPAKNDAERAAQLVATGFLAIGPKSHNEMNPRQFALDVADEQIETMSQAILGLTVACARCHDHKFDPIPQREYYSLAGIFLSTDSRYGTSQGVQNRHPSELIELPTDAGARTISKTLGAADRARKESQLEALKKEQQELFAERFKARMAPDRDAAPKAGEPAQTPARPANRAQPGLRPLVVLTQIGALESELKSFDASGQAKALAMGVQDRPVTSSATGFGGNFRQRPGARLYGGAAAFGTITDSPLYARGDVDKPGEKVPRGFLTVLSLGGAPAIPAATSGRRELADWLTTPQNPLTARVMANRIWHWLFGEGIVESVDNFGTMGQQPANPALLDHLATRLVENGWSMKKTIREIVLSHTYQLASTYDQKGFAADPENKLGWRHSKRRLDAECIRDAMLAAAGTLELKPPVGSAVAQAGEGPIGQRRFFGVSEDVLINANTNARSVYLAVARDVLPDALAVFDFAEPSLVTGARETTNVPSQALFLLNSPFAAVQAQKFAERVTAAYPSGPNGGVTANLDQRVTYAYWLAFARPPAAVERQAAFAFFSRFPSNWSKGDKSAAGMLDAEDARAAWTSFCRALTASAEFRYLN